MPQMGTGFDRVIGQFCNVPFSISLIHIRFPTKHTFPMNKNVYVYYINVFASHACMLSSFIRTGPPRKRKKNACFVRLFMISLVCELSKLSLRLQYACAQSQADVFVQHQIHIHMHPIAKNVHNRVCIGKKHTALCPVQLPYACTLFMHDEIPLIEHSHTFEIEFDT